MRECELIRDIRRRAGNSGKGVKTGIGDDCAVLDHGGKFYPLWAADMLIDGTHFRVGKTSYKKIGRKAVAVNISDIAAMGGVPKYITVSIGVPRNMKMLSIQNVYNGIFEICKEYGIEVVGGDTNRSSKLVIDVSILGRVEKDRLTVRSGAKKNDSILITGPVRNGKKEHLTFVPRLKESGFLTEYFKINAMIDTSDGIALDVSRICAESKAGCRIYSDRIPVSRGLTLKDALYYGESFELLFTMEKKEAMRLIETSSGAGSFGGEKEKYFIIGEITSPKNGLEIADKKGNVKPLRVKGYRHL